MKNDGVVAEQHMISHDTVDYDLPCNYEGGIGAPRKVGYSGWAAIGKKASSFDNVSVIRLPKLIFVSTNYKVTKRKFTVRRYFLGKARPLQPVNMWWRRALCHFWTVWLAVKKHHMAGVSNALRVSA